MRMNITLQQLTVFVRVADAGNFSEAARSMAVSQPALSRTVKALEDEVGERLFDRNTRNVHLTPAGLALRPVAERLIAEFTGSFTELAQFVAGRAGRITIAALPSVAAALLPRALARFQAERPSVEVLILDGLSGSITEAVASGRAEIGLTVQSPHTDALSYRPLLADDFGLVCRADDRLASVTGKLTWSVFADRPFIAMAPSSSVRTMTDAAFLQCGLVVRQLFECAFLGTTGHLVANGLGITALPELALPLAAAKGLTWRPLHRPLLRRHVGCVVRRARSLSAASARLLDLLTEEAARI
jgi:LysR family carnitine catabolism transcriptional activator